MYLIYVITYIIIWLFKILYSDWLTSGIFRIRTGVPDVVYLAGNFCFANRKNFCFLNFQLCFTDKNFKQPNCFWLSMHAYRILLPSETDDSRFNSREKHMLTDSVQPYNKPIIDLACSVCTVKYHPLGFTAASGWLLAGKDEIFMSVIIPLYIIHFSPNGLVFVSNAYSCFVLSRVENYFVIELKNSKKQIRPGKHGNIIFICPWHAKISWHGNEAIGKREEFVRSIVVDWLWQRFIIW
jgi:hypothetical protein